MFSMYVQHIFRDGFMSSSSRPTFWGDCRVASYIVSKYIVFTSQQSHYANESPELFGFGAFYIVYATIAPVFV